MRTYSVPPVVPPELDSPPVPPLLSVVPGVAIMLTVLSINFIGDALRDALDPRLVQRS